MGRAPAERPPACRSLAHRPPACRPPACTLNARPGSPCLAHARYCSRNAGIRRELTKPPPPCRAARSGMDTDTAIHPCLLGKGEPQREASAGRRARVARGAKGWEVAPVALAVDGRLARGSPGGQSGSQGGFSPSGDTEEQLDTAAWNPGRDKRNGLGRKALCVFLSTCRWVSTCVLACPCMHVCMGI